MKNKIKQVVVPTAHTVQNSLNVLKIMFSVHLVSQRGYLTWPPVFKSRPHTLPELREQIIQKANAIPRDMHKRAMQNLREGL